MSVPALARGGRLHAGAPWGLTAGDEIAVTGKGDAAAAKPFHISLRKGRG
jgi:hypothetical protein